MKSRGPDMATVSCLCESAHCCGERKMHILVLYMYPRIFSSPLSTYFYQIRVDSQSPVSNYTLPLLVYWFSEAQLSIVFIGAHLSIV